MKKQNFLKGSIILMVSAAAAKLLGAFFKIPLTNLLGGVGMSYFSCAYSLFMPVYALTVTGLTSAVARMTAKSASQGRFGEVRQIRRTALVLFSAVGLLGSLIILLLAKPFSIISSGNAESSAAVIMIAPAVFFGCITAVERGYYEGLSNMYPTAASQVIEGAVKVLAGLKFCSYVSENPEIVMRYFPYVKDVRAAAAAAGILGVTVSTAGAGVFFAIVGSFTKKTESMTNSVCMERGGIAKELVLTALPIGVSAVVTNLTAIIDMWTVIGGLSGSRFEKIPAGTSIEDMPYFVYGSFAGIALTVFNLVPSVTNMLGKGALTCITSAYERGDRGQLKNSTVQALIFSAVIAVPSAVGIAVLSEEILNFLYPLQADEAMICVVPLKILMPGMVCLCISYPLFSMLQAVGKPSEPLKIMLVGTAAKLIGNLVLIPKIGVNGAAVSTTICYTAILIISFAVYLKTVKIKIFVMPFAKVVYAGLMCGGAAYIAAVLARKLGAGDLKIILFSAFAGGFVYLGMIYTLMGVHTAKNKACTKAG